MALVKCKECGKEISDKSKKCNGCGAPTREVNPKMKMWLIFGLVLMVVLYKVGYSIYDKYFNYELIPYCLKDYKLKNGKCIKEVENVNVVYLCDSDDYEVDEGSSYCRFKNEYRIDPIGKYKCDNTYQEEVIGSNNELKCRVTDGYLVGKLDKPYKYYECPDGYTLVGYDICIRSDKIKSYEKYHLGYTSDNYKCPDGYVEEMRGLNLGLRRCIKYDILNPKYKKVRR